MMLLKRSKWVIHNDLAPMHVIQYRDIDTENDTETTLKTNIVTEYQYKNL